MKEARIVLDVPWQEGHPPVAGVCDVLTPDGPVRDVAWFGDEFVRQDGTPVAGPVRAWRVSLTATMLAVRRQTGLSVRVEEA